MLVHIIHTTRATLTQSSLNVVIYMEGTIYTGINKIQQELYTKLSNTRR